MNEIPFWSRLSTRLSLLIIVIMLVLAGATVILLSRGFTRINVSSAQALEQLGIEPTAELSAILKSTLVNLLAIFLLTLVAATMFSRSLLLEPLSSLLEATQRLSAGEAHRAERVGLGQCAQ